MEKCFKISGRVQGVGFRYWAVRSAARLGGISGYVCNIDNGDVLVYVAGTDDKIKAFKNILYSGPLFARVDYIEENPEYQSFFPPIENGVFKRI